MKLLAASAAALGRSPADPRRGVAVLAYHGTDARRGDAWWVDFRGQMRLVAELGYRVVSLGEVVRLLSSPQPPARPTLAITFDDGYVNNLRVAFPELARRGWPATVFVTTGWIGRRPFMRPDEIAGLAGLGVEAGAHSHSHPDLTALGTERARAEVAESRRRLEQIVGRPVRHFCYPYGRHDRAVRDAVAAAGLESACAAEVGFNLPGQDPLALRRLTVERGDGRRQLRLRLAGGYDYLRGWGRLARQSRQAKT